MDLVAALDRINDPATYAKWAGSLSTLDSFRRSRALGETPESITAIVCRFCTEAARDNGAAVRADPKSLNTLLRASIKLLKFRWGGPVSNAIYQVANLVADQSHMEDLIAKEAKANRIDAGHRANILLLSYVRFEVLRARDDGTRIKRRKRLFRFYQRVQMGRIAFGRRQRT